MKRLMYAYESVYTSAQQVGVVADVMLCALFIDIQGESNKKTRYLAWHAWRQIVTSLLVYIKGFC